MAASGRFSLHAAVVALLAAVAGGQVTMSSTAPPVLGFIDISGTGLAIAGVGTTRRTQSSSSRATPSFRPVTPSSGTTAC